MKKRVQFLSMIFIIVTAFLVLDIAVDAATKESVVATINNTTYTSLKEAVEVANEGDTVTLVSDTTENEVIEINVGITINGNNHKITSSLTGTDAVFLINTSSETIINKVVVETNTRGVAINNSVHNFSINNSTLKVGARGVTINSYANHDSILNINDCIIDNTTVNNYNEEVASPDFRGISLWEYKNSTITIKNTIVEGFTYIINIAPLDYSYEGTKLIIDNSVLKGRAGLNIWGSNLDIELTNSEILGINNFSGPSERFANIVINGTANNTKLNITNTKFTNYENETGLNNPAALQYMLSVRSINNKITISGDSSFIDSTNKLEDALYYGIDSYTDITEENEIITKNNIEITGGLYSNDVSDFVGSGYECVLESGLYQVREIKPNPPIIEIEEIDLNTLVDKVNLGAINTSATKEILLDTLTNTSEVNIENKNIKVTIDMKDIESPINQEKYNNIVKDAIIKNYFDISINVIDTDTNNIIGTLTELKDKISFGIIITSSLQNPAKGYVRKYYIIREHNDNYEILDTMLSEDGKSLIFETDKFSTYALAYVDELVEEEQKPEEKPSEQPDDNTEINKPENKPSDNPGNKDEETTEPDKKPNDKPNNDETINDTDVKPNDKPSNPAEDKPNENEKPDSPTIENPKTFDSLISYVIISSVSIAGAAVIGIYFKKKAI